MGKAEEFEELRPLLFSIAYRILGSVGEAEDAVQETWLRYDASATRPESVKAFLSAAVTRIAIDVLRSARVRREAYVGTWLPEPLLDDPYADPARAAELADSVSMASLLLLERLSPLERSVFVLREIFAFGFDDIAAAVGRSEAACRRAARTGAPPHARGAAPVRGGPRRTAGTGGPVLRRAVPGRRGRAAEPALRRRPARRGRRRQGPAAGQDHRRRGQGGPAPRRDLPLMAEAGITCEPRDVNGRPGAVFRVRDGAVLRVMSLDVVDGQIQTVRSILNPDKLGHLGPVADAWEANREVRALRKRDR